MNRLICLTFIFVVFSLAAVAQTNSAPKQAVAEKVPAAAAAVLPLDIAKAAVAAHGGDKLKNFKSLVLKGSVDLTVNNQMIPASFSTAISGEKYFFEINNPFQPIKQIFDGSQTYSSIRSFSLPPVTSLGFPLLPRIGDSGYVVSAIAEGKKKRRGFRVTTPDGFYTDFFVNDKTGQIKSFESSYDVGGQIVTTSVEVDEFQTVDGIVVPKKYSQRFDLGQMTAYANFNTKQILVNSTIEDSAFAIPK